MEYLRRIEEQFDADSALVWLRSNWTFSVYCSVFYLLSINLLKVYMRSHSRLVLRSPLATWSFVLAVYSTIGAYHTMLYSVHKVWKDGLFAASCDEVFIRKQTGLWLFLFVLSKLPELFDTYFIILRKGPLIFLHWYHHVTVLTYCWFSYSQRAVAVILFSGVNYFIHAIMYTYYGLKAKQVPIPRAVSMFITSLQILQMVFGMYMGFVMIYHFEVLKLCGVTPLVAALTLLMYCSYFVLFLQFFYVTYISAKKKPGVTKESQFPSIEKVYANGVGKIKVRSPQNRLLKYLNMLPYFKYLIRIY